MSIRSAVFKLVARFRMKRLDITFPLVAEVFGVDFSEHAGALAQSEIGDKLQFVHVPTENHPHNTFVYSIELNRILGYLSKPLVQKLRYIFGKGFCLDGEIVELTFEDGTRHCRVNIRDTSEMMNEHLDELPYLYESRND